MLADEDVQRQVAVVALVAVKEASLLMPVEAVVGGVEVQHDLPRLPLDVEIHQHVIDRGGVEDDLLVAGLFVGLGGR